jgi:acyl-CoA reductase-like NAD-dependent aldehyde dehydrogenase
MTHISDGQIHCIDPRTGAASGSVPATPIEEIPRRAQAARVAGQRWFDKSLKDRKAAVSALHQAFLAHAGDIAELLAQECGRPAGEAWTAEIVANHELFGWWLSHIDDLLTATPIDLNPINYPGKRGWVRLQPKGVIGLITPWNLPVAIPLRTIVPAVLSGNAVVWKPSEHTPKSAALLAQLFDAHLEPGLVACIQGDGEHGAAIVSSGVDTVFFTGSVRSGRSVAKAAANQGITSALELGGKDAAVVLEDANIERAAQGITWAAFGFAGQNCAGVERCYVQRGVLDAFVAAVVQRTEALRPGIDVGPLVTEAQFDLVAKHIAEALDAGATLAAGGGDTGPGFYHPPTVLTDVPLGATVLTDETFGPVLPIVAFDDLDELPGLVNNTNFGLTTSVWTSDTDLGEAIAENFDCGVVTINNHSFTGALASAAWTGTKDSGSGVTNSRFALYEMTRPRTVLIDRSKSPEIWWYPYNQALLNVTQGLVELSRSGGNRLPALSQTLSGLMRRWKESQ